MFANPQKSAKAFVASGTRAGARPLPRAMLRQARILHVSGISLAISPNAGETALAKGSAEKSKLVVEQRAENCAKA